MVYSSLNSLVLLSANTVEFWQFSPLGLFTLMSLLVLLALLVVLGQ
ncbi:hypothetical protein AM1_5736 [Acaryochloris marina MBIC11017]|uniref:Uncharacterized protein n=1 Tax=Acaryochloris marina (strain MBIC 11017) TaxID=329726 RepID=B0BZD6_ACAM1|nr:hypothetical protein AM1_5736 [Acaryochloris marina MBIC11017]